MESRKQTVRTDIEMTYLRCLPRTSSLSAERAPVIRKPSVPPCFRITSHRLIHLPDRPWPGTFHATPQVRGIGERVPSRRAVCPTSDDVPAPHTPWLTELILKS